MSEGQAGRCRISLIIPATRALQSLWTCKLARALRRRLARATNNGRQSPSDAAGLAFPRPSVAPALGSPSTQPLAPILENPRP